MPSTRYGRKENYFHLTTTFYMRVVYGSFSYDRISVNVNFVFFLSKLVIDFTTTLNIKCMLVRNNY